MLQVVLLGRVAAGVVLAHAAYAPLEGFRMQTGLPDVQYLFDARTDTHVSIPHQDPPQAPEYVLNGACQPGCWR